MLLASCLIVALLASCGKNEGNTSGSSTTADAGSTTTGSEGDGIFDIGSDLFGDESTATSGTQSGTAANSTASSKPVTSTVTSKPTYDQVVMGSAEFKKLPQFIQDTYKYLPELKTDSEKKVTVMYHADTGNSRLLGFKYGITAETQIVPWAELITRYVAAVNAGNGPDIVVDNYNYILINKGYVQAWDPYVDLSQSMWKAEKTVMSDYAVNGKNYYFLPNDPAQLDKQGYVLFNREMIEDAGLKAPDVLYEEGKWDWDAFINIADKLTNTTNKTYGCWVYNGPQQFVYSTGHDYVDFKQGKAINLINSSNVTRAIAAYSELVANKSCYPGANPETMVKRGQVAMAVTTTGGVEVALDEIKKGSCGFTAFPKDPQADAHYMGTLSSGYYLAKGAKHPNNAAAWLTVMHFERSVDYLREQNALNLAEGTGGVDEEYYALKEKINTSVKSAKTTWEMFSGDYPIYVSAVSTKLHAGEPWSKIAAEMSPLADAAIAAFHGDLNAVK